MKKYKKSTIIMLILIGVLFIGTTVQAQEVLKSRRMQVELKPEYDSSDVLVTYDAYLKNTSSEVYEGKVEFIVPADINLGSVCQITDAGEHNCQLYDVKTKGDKKIVVWEAGKVAPGEEYHAYLEYYFDPLKINGNSREFNFNYLTSYPSEKFIFKVTEPSQVDNFTANLTETGIQTDPYGLKDHFYKLTDITNGESLDLTISYERSTSGASLKSNSGQQEVTTQQSSNKANSAKNPMVLIVVLLILGIMGYFIYHSMGNKSQVKSKSKSLSSQEEKERARQLLLDGKIDEETYKSLIKDIEG
jgi:flagellar basal body-associated protein FliL